ncbi:nucleotidyltransferase family protein [uncultured Croceitalea sp.]|uniref:nucleotidyltransferase family protein n=1 Tax=uncultured Croceitalea sp. TaxID=1798908 RepID=UPI0033059847
MKTTADIGILILAAGASTRMGSPKQLLPWKHTTLLGNAIEQAEKVSQHVKVVLGANSALIQEQLKNRAIGIINDDWQKGMGASIAFGVSEMLKTKGYDGILIMLADQPFVDAAYLTKLMHCFKNESYKIVGTNYDKGVGVPAVFHSTVFTELQQLHEDYGARKLMKSYRQELLGIDANGKTVDVDTKEAYDNLIHKKAKPK